MIGQEVGLFMPSAKFFMQFYGIPQCSGVFTLIENGLNGVIGHHLKCENDISSLSALG